MRIWPTAMLVLTAACGILACLPTMPEEQYRCSANKPCLKGYYCSSTTGVCERGDGYHSDVSEGDTHVEDQYVRDERVDVPSDEETPDVEAEDTAIDDVPEEVDIDDAAVDDVPEEVEIEDTAIDDVPEDVEIEDTAIDDVPEEVEIEDTAIDDVPEDVETEDGLMDIVEDGQDAEDLDEDVAADDQLDDEDAPDDTSWPEDLSEDTAGELDVSDIGPDADPLRDDGEPCTEGSQCKSGHCFENTLCCDSACGRLCESCNLPGSEGECTNIPEHLHMQDDCSGTPPCTGWCDGQGQCTYPDPSTTACGEEDRYVCNSTTHECYSACNDVVYDDACSGDFVCDLLLQACVDCADSDDDGFGRGALCTGATECEEFDHNGTVYPGSGSCGEDVDCDGSLLDTDEGCDDGNDQDWDGCNSCEIVEFRVNNTTDDKQRRPSIAGLSNGGFVVAWGSNWGDSNEYGVFARRYDAEGVAEGLEFQVNTEILGDQGLPAVAALSDGGFVVVWVSMEQDGDSSGIFGQRYDANGDEAGAEFPVNTEIDYGQEDPSVAGFGGGGFVVTWQSYSQDGSGYGVFGQRFGASGATAGDEFPVNTITADNQGEPAVAALSESGGVITWACADGDSDGYGVFAQRYDENGPAGTHFRVNIETLNEQYHPAVAELSGGDFVIVWESKGQDGQLGGIFARLYDADGVPAPDEIPVNTYTDYNQGSPAIAPLVDGGFVIVWDSAIQDGELRGVFGQRYDAVGTEVGSEFPVNVFYWQAQAYPAVTGLSGGGFVVVWESNTQDGSIPPSWGIYAQRYDSDGEKVY